MTRQMQCRHFGSCGGCSHQDIPYEEQLSRKQAFCAEKLAPFVDASRILPIVPSPSQWAYRNKMEYSFSREMETQKLVCGLHRKDKRRAITDMQECPIFLEDVTRITDVVREYAVKYDLPYYSTYSHKGFLRYVVVRRSFSEGTLMVNVVTTTDRTLHEQELVDAFRALSLSQKLVSVCFTTSDAMGDAVVPEDVRCVWGDDHLTERVGANSYKIFPFTFFQVNPPALPAFYDQILSFADLQGHERVLDLYCGVGTISAVLSTRCKEVVGVEYTPESVRSAAENAAANGHPNMRFYAGDAGAVIRTYADTWTKAFDLAVVNPPRSGVMHKTLEKIVDLKIPTILYSSCNVKTLAENMAQIHDRYEMVAARPFDFFPHTDHFEVLTVLKRRA